MEDRENSVGLTFKAAGASATRENPNTSISHPEQGEQRWRDGGLTLSLTYPLPPPPPTASPPAQASAFSRVQQREDWGWKGSHQKWAVWKMRKVCWARTIDKERDRNQTNRQTQNILVLFCSDHKPKFESVLVHKIHLRVPPCLRMRVCMHGSCCVYLCESLTVNKAQVLAVRQMRQAGPEESYCNSGRRRERESTSLESAKRTIFWSGPYWHIMNKHEQCLFSSKAKLKV